LAITKHHRACKNVDLGTGIIDVIFFNDIITGKFQQISQNIADNGATAMPNMHRPRWISRDIFNVYFSATTDLRASKIGSGLKHCGQLTLPVTTLQAQVNKAWASNID